MAIPGNFLSATTEMVDPDTSGWQTVTNCTKSLGTGGRNGAGTLTLTSTAAGEMQASTASAYPVTAGTTYQTFADAASANQPERIGIQWLDATLTPVGSTTWSLTTNSASSSWHRIGVAGACPAGATQARVVLSATTTASAKTHAFENVYLGPPMKSSGNLLTFNAESGGEVDASGWAADVNATIGRDVPVTTWSATWYLSGGETIKLTAVANGDTSALTAETPTVSAGTEYIGTCYLQPPTTTASCWVELRWYDSSSALISTNRAVLAQPGTGFYRQSVSGVAPAGAATARLAVGITGATAGQVLRVETAVLKVATPLVDGSVVPYSDASFEAGIGQWTVVSGVATIARSAWGTAWEGQYSLAVTSSTATTSTLRSGRYPVTAGATWRAQVTIKVSGGSWGVAPQIHWYDSGGTSISVTSLPADSVPSDGVWWNEWNDGVAPANAATAAIELLLTAPAVSTSVTVDSAALMPSLPGFEVDPDDDLGNVTLIMRTLASGYLLTLYRIVGSAQTVVRGPNGFLQGVLLSSAQMTVEDYEVPLGQPVSYRYVLTDSVGAYKGGGQSAPVSVSVPDISDCWIKDPLQPQRNVRLMAAVAPDWARPIEQTEYRVRGRRNSVILYDVRGGLTGTLQVWTQSDAERAALHFALDTGHPLLLQLSPDLGIEDVYVAVGEAVEARHVPYGGEPRRLWQLPLTQQDAPIGGAAGSAAWTVQDLATTWTTVLNVSSAYATVFDVVLDNREA